MNLLANGLVQSLVISLLTSPCLSCAPATSPCQVTNTVQMGLAGLGPCDTASSAATNQLVSLDTCTIPNGDSFELKKGACDTGSLTGRPIILNGKEISVKRNLTFTCSGDGALMAFSGHKKVAKDVNSIDCYSSLIKNNCNFVLDNLIDPTKFDGNTVQCGGDTIENCAATDSQEFVIPENACEINGLNRPLSINGEDFPSTPNDVLVGDTVLTCSNTGLTAVNGDVGNFDTDIERIECSSDCVLKLNGNAATNTVAVGSCAANTQPTSTCIINNPTSGLLLTQPDLCDAAGDTVELVLRGGAVIRVSNLFGSTLTDTITIGCNNAGLGLPSVSYFDDTAGVGTTTDFVNIEQIICRSRIG